MKYWWIWCLANTVAIVMLIMANSIYHQVDSDLENRVKTMEVQIDMMSRMNHIDSVVINNIIEVPKSVNIKLK